MNKQGAGSVREVAAHLSLHPETVRGFIRMGKFPGAHKRGRGTRNSPSVIPWTDVEAFQERYPHGLGDARVQEVSDYLGRDPETIRMMTRAGTFPNAYKTGSGGPSSSIRIPWPDVEDYRLRQPRVSR